MNNIPFNKEVFKYIDKTEKQCVYMLYRAMLQTDYFLVDKSFDENDRLFYACFKPSFHTDNTVYKISPICLVAHVDTVQCGNHANYVYTKNKVYPEENKEYDNLIYMTDTGKIFDDRLGLGIIEIVIKNLIKNYKICPTVILLGHEETGCIGADKLVNKYYDFDDIFNLKDDRIQFLLEVDKSDSNKVCFYDLEYPDFERIFSPYYDKTVGSFSDISILCPCFNIAGANVSAGYFLEHTDREYATTNSITTAMNSLYNLIIDFQKYKGNQPYEYIDCHNKFCSSDIVRGLYENN